MTTLLLAGEQARDRELLVAQLRGDGFEIAAPDGRADVVLAGADSDLERWSAEAPVIVLGQSGALLDDRVQAFRRGCDDYLSEPFHYEELVERIRALVRRSRPPGDRIVVADRLEIDTASRLAFLLGVPLALSQKEFALLARMALDPERVFSKAELLRDVWGYRGACRTRTVDSHASRLRRKLRAVDPETAFVDNEWGVGYRLIGPLRSRA